MIKFLNITSENILGRTQRALVKAVEQSARLAATFAQTSRDTYELTGAEGDIRYVRVLDSDGLPFIHCSCDAGKNDLPCYHAAYIALRRGIAVDETEFFGFSPLGVKFILGPDPVRQKEDARLAKLLIDTAIEATRIADDRKALCIYNIGVGDTLVLNPAEGEFTVKVFVKQ